MNSITQALKTAGAVIPPLNKRVWLWLKDHPGKSAREVAIAIQAKHGDVSSTLGNLAKRRMVTVTQDLHLHRAQTLRYTTCIKEYELLPLPMAKRVPTPTAFPPAIEVSLLTTTGPTPAPLPTPKPLMEVLENYTMRDLRKIRDGLNRMFEYAL